MNVCTGGIDDVPRPGHDLPMQIVDDFIYEFQGSYVLEKEPEGSPQRGIDLFIRRDCVEGADYVGRLALDDSAGEYSQRLANYLQALANRADDVARFQERYRFWIDELLDRCRWKKMRFYVGPDYPRMSAGQVAVVDCRDVPSRDVPIIVILKAAVSAALRTDEGSDIHARFRDS